MALDHRQQPAAGRVGGRGVDDLDMASEMNEPAKPKKAANTSRPPRLWPCTASQASRPVTRATIDSTRTTARLVTRNRTMRFMSANLRV